MLYLLKKMIRDIKSFKTQFIAIFVMSLLSMLIYSGIEGEWNGMQDMQQKWFHESNIADSWISGTSMNRHDLTSIEKMKHIASAEGVIQVPTTNKHKNQDGQIMLMSSSDSKISKLHVTDGIPFNLNKNGIWIFQSYASENKIKIGDTITLGYETNKLSFNVVGFVISPEYLSYTGSSTTTKPNNSKYGYAYTSIENINKLTQIDTPFSQIRILYEKQVNGSYDFNENEITNIQKEIKSILGSKYMGVFTQSNFVGISTFIDKTEQIKVMSILFSFVFILLVLLTIQTTIKRMIDVQRTQIGTLKALGYRNLHIRLHYSLYGLFTTTLGCFIGYIIAPFSVASILLNIQSTLYSLPKWYSKTTVFSYLLFISIIFFSTLTALLASRKGTKEMPARTMRDAIPQNRKPIFIEHFSSFWNILSYEWKWAIRDAFKNKARTLIGIIGIIGSLSLLIAGLGMKDTLTQENKLLFGTQYNYEVKLILNLNATKEQKSEIQNLSKESSQWSQEEIIELRTAKTTKNSYMLIFEERIFIHFKNATKERISLPNDGVAITRKEANQLGLSLHDTVQIKQTRSEQFINVTIKEIIASPSPQGIYLSKHAWERMNQTFSPNIFVSSDKDIITKTKKLSYIKESTTLSDQLKSANDVVSSVMIIIIILVFAAIILCVVILYNLGLLSYTERSREYATLKVIGYQKKEIRSLLRRDYYIQVVIGIMLGIPIGLKFLEMYIQIASTHNFEYSPYISPFSFSLAIAIIIICSILVYQIVSSKIKKLNMIESLKSVE